MVAARQLRKSMTGNAILLLMRRSPRVQPVSWTVIASHEGYKLRIWGGSKGIVVGDRKVIVALLDCGQLFVVSAAEPSKQEMSDGSNPRLRQSMILVPLFLTSSFKLSRQLPRNESEPCVLCRMNTVSKKISVESWSQSCMFSRFGRGRDCFFDSRHCSWKIETWTFNPAYFQTIAKFGTVQHISSADSRF